jgi:hypothetical protein
MSARNFTTPCRQNDADCGVSNMGFDDTGLGAAMQASAQESATKSLAKRVEELETMSALHQVHLNTINEVLAEIQRILTQ